MDELNKRVVEVMEHFCSSKSVFASDLGIGLPTIAHIFSGRNKPGVDILQKILLTYPTVNATWLMIGKGEMKTIEKVTIDIENELIRLNSLIDNLNTFNNNTSEVIAYHKLFLDELRHISELDVLLANSQIDLTKSQQKLRDELSILKSKVLKDI
jgi:transcriptional regulator with XRE-family HTH domain